MEWQTAFGKLKQLFTTEPVLKYPDVKNHFITQTDASDVAVGAVLIQENENRGAYTSKKLSETKQ